MERIRNCEITARNFYEPACFLALAGVAFIGGKSRIFRCMSNEAFLKGVLIHAGISSGVILAYNTFVDDDSYSKSERMAHKLGAHIFAALCSTMIAITLKDKIRLPLSSAAKFGALQFIISIFFTKTSLIDSTKYHLANKEYSKVVEDIKLLLKQLPEKGLKDSIDIFEIIGVLFEKSREHLNQLIPSLKENCNRVIHTEHYLRIEYTAKLDNTDLLAKKAFTIHSKLSELSSEDAISVIKMRRIEDHTKLYLHLALEHPIHAEELMSLAVDACNQLINTPYSYVEQQINIATYYFVKRCDLQVNEKITEIQDFINTIGDDEIKSEVQSSLEEFKEEIEEHANNSDTVQFEIDNRWHDLIVR